MIGGQRKKWRALMQVSNRKSLLGEGACMQGKSLGLFGIRNRLRLGVFTMLYSQARQPSSYIAAACPLACPTY